MGSDLYVGGPFLDIVNGSGYAYPKIARWDGTAWHPVGSGLNLHVSAFAVMGQRLCVGGWFTHVGDFSKVSAYFAVYNTGPLAAPAELAAAPGPRLDLFPNPATTTVRLQAPAAGPVTLLDLAGRAVRRYPAGVTTLDVAGVAPGLYAVRVGSQTRRLVVE